jgi:hypothetical protein
MGDGPLSGTSSRGGGAEPIRNPVGAERRWGSHRGTRYPSWIAHEALLQQNNLPNLLEAAKLQAIEVDAAGHGMAPARTAVPRDGVNPTLLLAVDERSNDPASDVIDFERRANIC